MMKNNIQYKLITAGLDYDIKRKIIYDTILEIFDILLVKNIKQVIQLTMLIKEILKSSPDHINGNINIHICEK